MKSAKDETMQQAQSNKATVLNEIEQLETQVQSLKQLLLNKYQ
jgi:hypothetical protein